MTIHKKGVAASGEREKLISEVSDMWSKLTYQEKQEVMAAVHFVCEAGTRQNLESYADLLCQAVK